MVQKKTHFDQCSGPKGVDKNPNHLNSWDTPANVITYT